MVFMIVMATIVIVGIAAIALAEPHRTPTFNVWNDETERRLLHEGKSRSGW
jgi:hypothetical protein